MNDVKIGHMKIFQASSMQTNWSFQHIWIRISPQIDEIKFKIMETNL
jgi:hypothetical protein